MIRPWLAALAVTALLAGCSAPAPRAVFPHHFALSANTAAPAATPVAGRATLRVDAIGAPPWLDDTGMHYRLAYRNDRVVAAYTESDWVAPPARMLDALVRRALDVSGAWRIVVGPGDPVHADLVLRLRLDQFGQVFTAPDQSHGVLDATATLVTGSGDRALAQRRFTIRAPATTPDAAGGAAALDAASVRFAAELGAWLRKVASDPATGSRHRGD